MSTDRDVTGIVRTWLEVGATALPDRVLDNVLDRLPATPQRRPWWPTRRFRHMTIPARMALAAAAIGIVAVVGVSVQPRSSSIGGPTVEASPSPLRTPTPSTSPGRLAWSPASAAQDWPAPVRAEPVGDPVIVPFAGTHIDQSGDIGSPDVPWIDIRRVSDCGSVCLDVAAMPPDPLAGSNEPWIAYGLVVDSDSDGVPDLRYGIDTMPARSRFGPHVWRTDLRTGRTESSTADPPVGLGDFVYPGGLRGDARAHLWPIGGLPARFYAWASMIQDGRVVATDYAPDPGWLDPSAGSVTAPLQLEPPADVDAYVRSAYEGLVDLPALSVTIVEEEGSKERYLYDGTGIVRYDHFGNKTDSQPLEHRILSADDNGSPLLEIAYATGMQGACETAWEYVGLEYLIDRPTHHVACGASGMWLDVETRLPLRSVRVQPQDIGPTIRFDVVELQVGPQPADLFVPLESSTPVPSARPIVTPAPAPGDLAAPADLDTFVAEVLATYPTLPALEMVVGSDDSRTRYLSDGSGRYRMEGGSKPSATQLPSFLYTGGHSYEPFEQDDGHVIWQDQGPDVYVGIPDLDLGQGCRTRWEHRGFDLVLDRPAHHLVCSYDEYWIDRDSLLVVRHQRNPDPLHYDTNVDEVVELRFVEPPAELFELPADADVRDVGCPSFIPGRRGCEPRPSGAASGEAIGTGPALTWTKVGLDATAVAWLGDRFILADEDAHTASTSTDGRTWEAIATTDRVWGYYDLLTQSAMTAGWQDNMVGWDPNASGPGVVRVVHPPAAPVTKTDFEGKVATVGIGPAGIVARVHSGIDFDAFVTTFLGPDWVGHMTDFDFQDGVLHIATTDGRTADIVMADHGLGPGDVADRGYGWYSADGASWTVIADFPSNTSDVVGVSNGFIARAESTWYSPDGMTWREIGAGTEGAMVPWREGVLTPGPDGLLELWTADGSSTLPMAAELPPGSLPSNRAFGAGSLGLVSMGTTDILYTPNGTDWSIGVMPDPMYASGGARRAPTIAVGDDSVVVLMWSGGGSPIPSLWVGVPES